jgi:hypothetical protein
LRGHFSIGAASDLIAIVLDGVIDDQPLTERDGLVSKLALLLHPEVDLTLGALGEVLDHLGELIDHLGGDRDLDGQDEAGSHRVHDSLVDFPLLLGLGLLDGGDEVDGADGGGGTCWLSNWRL